MVVVVLEGVAEIPHIVVVEPFVVVVAAENVAAEKDLLFVQVGAHGVGPMQERRAQERDGLVAQRNALARADRLVVHLALHQRLEHHHRAARDDELRLRGALHQLDERTGVVGFEVVQNDVADLAVVAFGFQPREELGGELLLDRVHDAHALAAAHDVAVVGAAVGGLHDDVEGADHRVEGPDKIDAGGERRARRGHHGRCEMTISPLSHRTVHWHISRISLMSPPIISSARISFSVFSLR